MQTRSMSGVCVLALTVLGSASAWAQPPAPAAPAAAPQGRGNSPATGKEDGLITTMQATVDMLNKHGFAPVFQVSPGGLTWINWRNYLNEFVPQLFQ